MVEYKCPYCYTKFKASQEVGKSVSCLSCGVELEKITVESKIQNIKVLLSGNAKNA